VDGGKGQMEVVRNVVEDKLQLSIPIAGLVKDDRHRTSELLYGFPPTAIGIAPRSALFHLMEQIQNEVHRFAITFHKNKRSKGTFKTSLTDIKGIGLQTARELLLKFHSVKQIKNTSFEDLAKCVGPAKAKIITEYFNTGQ
jgi:excinuclease ABC subunit C